MPNGVFLPRGSVLTVSPVLAGSPVFVTSRDTGSIVALSGATPFGPYTNDAHFLIDGNATTAIDKSFVVNYDTLTGQRFVARGNIHAIAIAPGDSRNKNFHISTGVGKSSQHPLCHALTQIGQRARVVYNGGISGNQSGQYLTANSPDPGYIGINNLTAFLSTDAMWAYWGGMAVNDFTAGRTAANVWNGFGGNIGIRDALIMSKAAGKRNIIALEIGANGMNPTEVHLLNGYILDWIAVNPQDIVFNLPAIVWTKTNQSTITIANNIAADGTHLLSWGAWLAGAVGASGAASLAALLLPLIPPWPRMVSAALETKTLTSNRQMVTNPLMITATGGTAGTGITGNVPAGYGVSRGAGTPTATTTVIADPNGFGNALQVDCTFGAQGDIIRVYADLGTTGWTPGKKYVQSGRVEVANGSSNLCFPAAELEIVWNSFGASRATRDNYATTAYGIGPTTAYGCDLETDGALSNALTIPPFTNVSQVWAKINLLAFGAGSGSVVVSRMGVYELNA